MAGEARVGDLLARLVDEAEGGHPGERAKELVQSQIDARLAGVCRISKRDALGDADQRRRHRPGAHVQPDGHLAASQADAIVTPDRHGSDVEYAYLGAIALVAVVVRTAALAVARAGMAGQG